MSSARPFSPLSTPPASRASREEKERLVREFIRLCEVESPSLRERAIADTVTAELRSLGLEVSEDGSSGQTGSEAGNLLARIPGPEGAHTVLLCAHLDTVPLTGPVEVVRDNEVLSNRHEAILGADNKAAVAVLLAVARRAVREPAPVGLELLFTVCEERALAGAKAFDRSLLRAEFGFVFDHASPIGDLVVAAPTHYRIHAELVGQAAHAGIRPEAGRSAIEAAAAAVHAMRLGRLDEATTANAGRIEGGTAMNVVPERCSLELEARSLDPERATRTVSAMVDAITEAASDGECDVEIDVDEQFRGYRLARSSAPVAVAAAALEGLGIEPRYISTGGGSDANAFHAAGLTCLNVADGSERNHQPDERISVGALETTLDLALGIVARGARPRRGMGFERIASDEVWSGTIASVRVDRFRYDDGEEAEREIVSHPGAVGVVAHDGEAVYLVAQPRESAGEQRLLELPAGKLDDEGEDVLATAKRELAEEIGKAAKTWRHLTTFYSSPGFSDEQVHVYMASDLHDQSAQAGENERIEIERVPLDALDEAISSCRDAKSLVGLLWLRAYGDGT